MNTKHLFHTLAGSRGIALVSAFLFTFLTCASAATWRTGTFFPADNTDTYFFDPRKAEQLTPERKRQLEVALFNELYMMGEGNREARLRRKQRVADMAREGFEVAQIAYDLYAFEGGILQTFKQKSFDRLKELADTGDSSAACFLARVMRNFPRFKTRDGRPNHEAVYPYISHAANNGNGYCARLLSGYYRIGLSPIEQDIETAIYWMLTAGHRDDLSSQIALAHWYLQGSYVTQSWTKANCWIKKSLDKDSDQTKSVMTIYKRKARQARSNGDHSAPKWFTQAGNCQEEIGMHDYKVE